MEKLDIRDATIKDANALQSLYEIMHPNDPVVGKPAFKNAFSHTIKDPAQTTVVGLVSEQLVAASTFYVLANLTRGCRPFAMVENVITHTDFRRQGYGRLILHECVERARQLDCYKIMLMTGSKRDEVLGFYENVGFKQNKTGFQIRF